LREILEEIDSAVIDRGTTAIQSSSVARLPHTIVFVLLGFVFS
jgi:hypothetical protein